MNWYTTFKFAEINTIPLNEALRDMINVWRKHKNVTEEQMDNFFIQRTPNDAWIVVNENGVELVHDEPTPEIAAEHALNRIEYITAFSIKRF